MAMSETSDEIDCFLDNYDSESFSAVYDPDVFYRIRYQVIKEAAEKIQSFSSDGNPDIDPDI